MPKQTPAASAVKVSWWLTDGDEECSHCGRMYFYEVEFRCTVCDEPGCPYCRAKHAEGYAVCLNCADASEA